MASLTWAGRTADRRAGWAGDPGMTSRETPSSWSCCATRSGSIVDEMALVVARTARSATVRDALDYSTALCAPDGDDDRAGARHRPAPRLVPVGRRRRSCAATAAGSIAGDVFILNDPYGWGGIHLPDIYLVKPIFHDDRLVGVRLRRRASRRRRRHRRRQQLDGRDRGLPGGPADPRRQAVRPGRPQRGDRRHPGAPTCASRSRCWATSTPQLSAVAVGER